MDILLLLIPLSVAIVFLAAWAFRWCLDNDQFEDLERQGSSILFDADHSRPPEGAQDERNQSLEEQPPC